MKLKTCVTPDGRFVYGVHKPFFTISNLREKESFCELGSDDNENVVMNHRNFPETSVEETNADMIYEVPNPFSFRGTTYIASGWANAKSKNPSSICLPKPVDMSFSQSMRKSLGEDADLDTIFSDLPHQMLLAIAAESTDSEELTRLAEICCDFQYSKDSGELSGLRYEKGRPVIRNHTLFETVVNNNYLPVPLREVMVLRPGIQGGSEIMAEFSGNDESSHVYEYLRRNSYIPWGHFAANMSEDAVRYDMAEMTPSDLKGLRHLYYQRTYARLGEMTGAGRLDERKQATEEELESLRIRICENIQSDKSDDLFYNATLWGWNYGFNFTPAGYNLHGSHQQIHQQYALIPAATEAHSGFDQPAGEDGKMETYGCGDQIYQFIRTYRKETGNHFFDDYMKAIRSNKRMDRDDDTRSSLIVHEDENVILFVPKAQTSQWELNLITKEPMSNILETDTGVRNSLDNGMLKAMKTLTSLGARMITVIEFSGRFDVSDEQQHLMYAFLPKIPYSMGAFTEAQQRYINGHFPEDFAFACREVCG